MVAKVVPRQVVLMGPPEAAAVVPLDVAEVAAPTVALFADPTPTLACCANATVDINGAIAAVTATAADKIASIFIDLFMNNHERVLIFSRFAIVFGIQTH